VTAPVTRSTPAQQGPPASFDGIPARRPTGTYWYREHNHRPGPGGGCWYYAPLPADPAEGGRFDLPSPEGTCYLANRERVAAMERVGRFTSQRKPVPAGLVRGRVVTTVETSTLPAKTLNLVSARAQTEAGVTGELFAGPDYSLTQAWAAAIRAAGHDALTYAPRFSPGDRAIAVFGPEGPGTQPVVSSRPLQDVLAEAGISVAGVPSSSAIKIVAP
jgi:hypothetical protein